MGTNVFETAEADINIKYENDINDVQWTVLDTDSSAYDFSNKTDSDLNIYKSQGDTAVVLNVGENATSGLSYASNVISWNDPWTDLSVLVSGGTYYYEITYEDSVLNNPTVKIIDGVLKVL